ncbi:MAG: hypothetical protein H0T46_33045 [Deltaproteobacteria bacterium]|nr:hypothetical protein [Deltaproteobacteria bacterium]
MRYPLVALILVACGKAAAPPIVETTPVATGSAAPVVAPDAAVAPAPPAPPPGQHATLADALAAIIPADARVVGFGELHARVDRAQVKSALSLFTTALPSLGDKFSDLIVETFIVDPKCGQTAQKATQQMQTEVKRPEATKSEIALLADAAKAAKIQPHAMTLSCADYKALVPNGQIDPLAMLTITTRELKRIALSAVAHRDKDAAHRPWIALYGGALHNDRSPDDAVKEWSYAAAVDTATKGRFVEVDLIVPELAAADANSKKQPWFSLVETAGDWVQVFKRNDRSFVVVLPRTK